MNLAKMRHARDRVVAVWRWIDTPHVTDWLMSRWVDRQMRECRWPYHHDEFNPPRYCRHARP